MGDDFLLMTVIGTFIKIIATIDTTNAANIIRRLFQGLFNVVSVEGMAADDEPGLGESDEEMVIIVET